MTNRQNDHVPTQRAWWFQIRALLSYAITRTYTGTRESCCASLPDYNVPSYVVTVIRHRSQKLCPAGRICWAIWHLRDRGKHLELPQASSDLTCRKHSWRFIKPLMMMHSVQQMLLRKASASFHLRPLSSLPGNSWPCLGAWLWQNELSNGSWLTPVSKTYISWFSSSPSPRQSANCTNRAVNCKAGLQHKRVYLKQCF